MENKCVVCSGNAWQRVGGGRSVVAGAHRPDAAHQPDLPPSGRHAGCGSYISLNITNTLIAEFKYIRRKGSYVQRQNLLFCTFAVYMT